MTSKWEGVRGFTTETNSAGQMRLRKSAEIKGKRYVWTSQWRTPYIQKNGNLDRFWLMRAVKELWRDSKCNGEVLGQFVPSAITYVSLKPTTGEVIFRRPK